MAAYTAADVKELREITGAGMMDCKKALEECAGVKEKAVDFLRTKGLASLAKKASRIAAEGFVFAGTSPDFKTGVILELNCETDFVSKNSDFQSLGQELVATIISNNVTSPEGLLAATLPTGKVASDALAELVFKIGEKIEVRRFEKKYTANGLIGAYTHVGKIGALVEANISDTSKSSLCAEAIKDVCLHLAASDTRFLRKEQMDESFIAKEAEIYTAQLKEQGKAENMIPGIVKGKINKLASEVCLLEQKFVKNSDLTVAQFIEDSAKIIGTPMSLVSFSKFIMGEGLQKKQDNFADEVNQMMKS